MSRYSRRLIVALGVSVSCLLLTELWYRLQAKPRHLRNNKASIATLKDYTNEVQRRPWKRVIWESVGKDEVLYPGEAIRTSGVSEAQILFTATNTLIQLEPDSLIVIEENSNGIALDFLQGGMLVKSGGDKSGAAESQGLTLKSGDNQIRLANANASLSKTGKNDVKLEVFGGSAEVQQGEKKLTMDQNSSATLTQKTISKDVDVIKILSPVSANPVYLDVRKKEPVHISWEKLPEGYTVYFVSGTSRHQLKRNTTLAAAATSGTLDVPLRAGKYYWQLVAEAPNQPGRHSQILSTEVIDKLPPYLLEPESAAKVGLNNLQRTVRLKWSNPAGLKNLVLEISKEANLTNKIIQKPLSQGASFEDIELKESGTYYWRLTGFMPIRGQLEPLPSDVGNFQLQVNWDLSPPALRSPVNNQKMSYQQITKSGLFISWDQVPGVQSYQIQIEKMTDSNLPAKSEPLIQTAATSPYRLQSLDPGMYRWTMYSIGDKEQKSKPAPYQSFTVTDLPKVLWADGDDSAESFYFTARPHLQVGWQKQEYSSWRYRYAKEGQILEEAKWQATKVSQLEIEVPEDGAYQMQVEAVDKPDHAIARSSVKSILVKPSPLLPAPQFANGLPKELRANTSGNLELSWSPVTGAQHYLIEIQDGTGQVLDSQKVNRTEANMRKMKPGQYKVQLMAVDQHNRRGIASEARPIEVPATSGIKAPKLKTIQVK